MQTAKPKSNLRKILLVAIVIAVIAGGVAAYIFLVGPGAPPTNNDFSLVVKVGNPTNSATWNAVTVTTVLLNGTSMEFAVVASVDQTSSFKDFIQLNFSSPVNGVTGIIPHPVLNPKTGGSSATQLNITAPPDAPTGKDPYNFTVTGTGGGHTHVVTFPLLIRSSVMRIDPVSLQPAKNSTFNVQIGVSDVYSFHDFQFFLDYNASLIKADNYSLAPIFYATQTNLIHSHGNWYNTTGGGGILCDDLTPACDGFPAASVNNVRGEVYLASTLIYSCGPLRAPCPDSPGNSVYNIANVTFTSDARNAGMSSLQLTGVIVEQNPPGTGFAFPISPPDGLHLLSAAASVTNRSTTTSITCTSPVVHETSTNCTATVTDVSPGNLMTPTGVIRFTNSTGFLRSCTLVAMSPGVASCPSGGITVVSTPGTETITASYPGDASHDKSSNRFDVTVT